MRKAGNLSQDDLATDAGLNRMTVQRAEAGQIDPRLSSVLAIAKTTVILNQKSRLAILLRDKLASNAMTNALCGRPSLENNS